MYTSGYVYVLSNPAIQGYKIGRTKNLEQRLSSLQSTGVPKPFFLERADWFIDSVGAEKLIHEWLREFRLSSNREFFACSMLRIVFEMHKAQMIEWGDVDDPLGRSPYPLREDLGLNAGAVVDGPPIEQVHMSRDSDMNH